MLVYSFGASYRRKELWVISTMQNPRFFAIKARKWLRSDYIPVGMQMYACRDIVAPEPFGVLHAIVP